MKKVTIRSALLVGALLVIIITVVLGRRLALRDDEPKEPFSAESFRENAKVPAVAYAAIARERDVLLGADGPADANTTFEVASIAKPLIALSVLKLVDEGKLALDVDVSAFVGFGVKHPTDDTPITLRMLLTHTSSIADDAMSAAPGGPPLDEFLRKYLARSEAFSADGPGVKSVYSNVGPSLAALAVEVVEKTPFADWVKKHLFEPLGMKRTTYNVPLPPFAPPHAGMEKLASSSHALWPVVDLYSSAADLTRFARAMLRGEILRPATRAMMFEEGLGWQKRTIGGRSVSGHEGEDKGASTGLYLDVSAGTGALFLANGDAFTSNDPTRAKALQDLLEALLDAASRASP